MGEPSFVTDLNKMKIGNGEDLWKDLPYLGGDGEGTLKHSLFIGPHEFNGSEDVVVPVYGGNMMMNSPFMTMSPTTTMTDGLHQCDVSEEP